MIQDKNEKWRLTAEDIRINHDDMFIESENNCISAYIETWFDVDDRFGTATYGTNDYINLYAEYFPYAEDMSSFSDDVTFLPELTLYYFIHYANGDVSESIVVTDMSESEKTMIFDSMQEAGLEDMVFELGSKSDWEG
jgi:hypothetical protein